MIRLTKTTNAITEKDVLKCVPLGGFEEVGRNMMFFEYKNEIVILDVGLQFPEEETPGIDYIIPNISCLQNKKENIKAIILTHGHYDHIGAIPYLIEKLGNPPIYCTELTKHIVLKRQEDFPNAPKLKIHTVKNWDEVEMSRYFTAQFFGVEHNIPDTAGIILKTPAGNIVHFADFKIGYDEKGNPERLDEFEKVRKQKILALFLDSTNAEEEGRSLSERVVEKNLEDLFKKAPGRILLAIFASLLTRIAEIIKIAEKLGRRIALSGLTMKTNIQIAQNLGYIKAKKDTIINIEEIGKYKDEKILILTTGAQGEPNASLMRVANGEHRHIQIKPGDTVIFSASTIPGNERQVQLLKDNLSRQGARVITSKIIDIHSSGHSPQEELKMVIKLINPKFLIPVHGYYFMRYTNCENGAAAGMERKNCLLPDNGAVLEMSKNEVKITDKTVEASYVMVDGLGVGDVGAVVLRDRLTLSQEGMVVIIVTLGRHNGRILKNPDIISRGFIYLKENVELLEEIRRRIRGIIGRIPRYQPIDSDYLKALIRDQIGQFLYTKTKRRPMVLPVVIEV
jgi:ribonuclease J